MFCTLHHCLTSDTFHSLYFLFFSRPAMAFFIQRGMTHAFIVNFKTAEHRDYYATKDPAHLDFVASLKPLLDGVMDIDFVDGEF